MITDDLTSQDPDKIAGNVPHCTITCIAESPFTPDTLMVGTDDGLVQLTQDGGHSWTNLTGRLSGMPQGWWVSRVVLSEHKKDRAYVTVSGYREDDMRPLVWRTEDLGQTWMRLDEGLPQVPVNVLREDPSRADTLYLGTELGVLASLDGGDTWNPLGSGLPTIAVHDIAVQSEAQELVLGTHGRGFWVLDISTLGSWNEEIANGPVPFDSAAHPWVAPDSLEGIPRTLVHGSIGGRIHRGFDLRGYGSETLLQRAGGSPQALNIARFAW